ncbi:DUF6392 family protein [Photorhabdus temperata]|uniref:Pyocin s3 immunity protein n=1 Tax=Photorhabdus temperata J3 TaxID=1389415 RepID=U7QSQ6_PHOTE|nr:DUF6392 family protein [Photorhabdus temperata]EQB99135.1 hypothetical protein B738_19906 [Photorhabdus temperata subsp. temperata M1021]ERT11004.1 pyocin s3 immunity protein [Photorhabdus temperata J3]
MATNIEALINNLSRTYQEIFDEGLIPYKTKPKGDPGCYYISLNMIKEGVYLAFKRDSKELFNVTITLIDRDKPSYQFPNQLPSPLVPMMSRQWIHENFGEPKKFHTPEIIMKQQFGWTELYTLLDFRIPTSMQVDYDLLERVESVIFLPTSEVRW